MSKYTLVDGDDWVGLYIDGKLVFQSHNISPTELATHLGVDLETVWADVDWLSDLGFLPKNLDEVVVE